jgi:hypothetical protein
MTIGTGITGVLNSPSCGRVFLPSGCGCCTNVWTAKEKAVLAFGSGVGLDRSGRLYNVTCDSFGLLRNRREVTISISYARDSTTSEFISFTNPSCSIALLVKFLLVSK